MISYDSRNKIIIVEPPFYRLYKSTYSLHCYPLSLGYLGGEIRKRTNWDVMTYNADFFPAPDTMKISYITGAGFDNYLHNLKDMSAQVWLDVEATIAEYGPAVVGISAKSQNFTSALIVAKIAKKINKNIIVVMGGPHPTFVGEELLDHPEIDIGVVGEGENTVVELLNSMAKGDTLHGIPGILFRDNGVTIKNSSREYIADLDSLCFPHESAEEILKDYDNYPKTAFGNIFATRGCPYDCSFCGSRYLWSRKVRYRSPENVVREIKSLQKIGLNHIRFDDDTFGVDRNYIFELCEALKINCPGLTWSCELHVKLITESNVAIMKSAGCIAIQVGIESGNNEILKKIRKNMTIEEALEACTIINKSGVKLSVFFIVGFPDETEKSLQDTICAIKKIKSYSVHYNIFTPYPGTETFDSCKKAGLIGENYDVSLYNHQSPENCFCTTIDRRRFRKIITELELSIDRKNMANRIKGWFSYDTCRTIARSGILNSIGRGFKVLRGR